MFLDAFSDLTFENVWFQIIDNPGLAELIQEDAKAIKNRQETDSIPLVDDIRHHLYNAILPSYSGDVSCFAEHRIELLESLLKKLDLECWTAWKCTCSTQLCSTKCIADNVINLTFYRAVGYFRILVG